MAFLEKLQYKKGINMKTLYFITSIIIATIVFHGCGDKSSSKNGKKRNESNAPLNGGDWNYNFEETINGVTCKTEKQGQGLERYCLVLKDHKTNDQCAYTQRKTSYDATCQEYGAFPAKERKEDDPAVHEEADDDTINPGNGDDSVKPTPIERKQDSYVDKNSKITFVSKKSDADGCQVASSSPFLVENNSLESIFEGPTRSEILRVRGRTYDVSYFSYSHNDINVLTEIREKIKLGKEVIFTNERDCLRPQGGSADYAVFKEGLFYLNLPTAPPAEKYPEIDLSIDRTNTELENQLKFSYGYSEANYFWTFSYINDFQENQIAGDTVKYAIYNEHAKAFITEWREMSTSEMKMGSITIKDQRELKRIIPQQHHLKVVFHVKTPILGEQRWVLDYRTIFLKALGKYVDNQTEPKKTERRSDTEDEHLWRWNISEDSLPNL